MPDFLRGIFFVISAIFFFGVPIFGLLLYLAGRRNSNSSFSLYNKVSYDGQTAPQYIRKKEIPEDAFFKPDKSLLPVKDYNDSSLEMSDRVLVSIRQDDVLLRMKKKMLRFKTSMTNDEIKEQFGTANLELIAGYEENYTQYMYSMYRWAQSLADAENYADAERVLKTAVMEGSELSKCFILLADIYLMNNDRKNMEWLDDVVYASDMPAKIKTSEYISNALSQLK